MPVSAKFGENVDGLQATIISYSVVTILAGALAWFVCQDETHSEDKANFHLADMAFVPEISTVWLAGVVTSCMWSIYIGFGMATPYLTQTLHMGGSEVAVASILCTYMLFTMGGLIGGQLVDHYVSYTRFIIYTFINTIAFTIVYFSLPGESHYVTITPANMAALGVFIYSANAVLLSTIDEVRIPAKVTGIAVGLISLLAYFPEIYCYTMMGNVVNRKSGVAGYQDALLFILVCAFIGLIAVLILQRVSCKSKNRVDKITENNVGCTS